MKKTSALLVLIFCTLLPVCGISGQRGLSPDICEVLNSTILMPYEIPNATRGNKTQKNTPAAYYYDEHGYAAACAFVTVEGCNELFILEKHDGTWQIENRSRSIVHQQDERVPSITCEEYGKFYLAYLAEDGQAEEMLTIEKINNEWRVTAYSLGVDSYVNIEMDKKGASYLGDITQWKRKKLRTKGTLKTAIEDFDIIRLNEIASNLIAQEKN